MIQWNCYTKPMCSPARTPAAAHLPRHQIPGMPKHFAKYTSKWPVGSRSKCFWTPQSLGREAAAQKQPDGTTNLYKLQRSDLVRSSASLAAQTTSLTCLGRQAAVSPTLSCRDLHPPVLPIPLSWGPPASNFGTWGTPPGPSNTLAPQSPPVGMHRGPSMSQVSSPVGMCGTCR